MKAPEKAEITVELALKILHERGIHAVSGKFKFHVMEFGVADEIASLIERLQRENIALKCCGNCEYKKAKGLWKVCTGCFPGYVNWQPQQRGGE